MTNQAQPHQCPIQKALSIFGDRWSLLVIRDVLQGIKQFDQLQASLNISRNLLTQRLKALEESELIARTPLKLNAKRMVYTPTKRCIDLLPTLIVLGNWVDKWEVSTEGDWSKGIDIETGQRLQVRITNEDGNEVPIKQIRASYDLTSEMSSH
ncbi:MAG: helix-turn-helix domain-containing protein [Bermanella sp.]